MNATILPCPFCSKRLQLSEAFSSRSQGYFMHPPLGDEETPCIIEDIRIPMRRDGRQSTDLSRLESWNRRPDVVTVRVTMPEATEAAPLYFTYRNWRGAIGERTVYPYRIEWGATEWHPAPQWLIVGYDIGKSAERAFAFKDIIPEIDLSESFQSRVAIAHHALFHGDPTDIAERRARYFEESNETCQAFGMTREEAHALVDYTYDRPAGDPGKEAGAAMLTLTSLCIIAGHDLMASAEAELEKLQQPETIARIRAKRSTRHGRGPLPGHDPKQERGNA